MCDAEPAGFVGAEPVRTGSVQEAEQSSEVVAGETVPDTDAEPRAPPNGNSEKLSPRSRFFSRFFVFSSKFLEVFGCILTCSDASGRV